MKYNISQLKPEIKKVSHFYQGLLLEENKEQENNERDTLYNTPKQISDKMQQQEISINIENNNNKDEIRDNIKEKKLERMIDDKTDNLYSNIEDMYTNDNTTLSSIVNSTIYDLQALLSQRQDGLSVYYTSIINTIHQ